MPISCTGHITEWWLQGRAARKPTMPPINSNTNAATALQPEQRLLCAQQSFDSCCDSMGFLLCDSLIIQFMQGNLFSDVLRKRILYGFQENDRLNFAMKLLTWMARRFVAGDGISDALIATRKLNQKGLKATLDYLGEDCNRAEDARRSCAEYCALLKAIAESNIDSNVSLKLSQLGLGFDEGLARGLLETILVEAAKYGNFVRVDMEGSNYTQKTLDLFKEVFSKHKNVGIVIQASLRRSKKDIDDLVALGVRVRLCKGAYKEPASIAFPEKSAVNRNYDELARSLLKAPLPAFATHDDERIEIVARAAKEAGLGKDQYEIQMLYGLREKRWEELRSLGHTVRIYVPYGTHWIPYFYRRIRERKENLTFVLKNLFN